MRLLSTTFEDQINILIDGADEYKFTRLEILFDVRQTFLQTNRRVYISFQLRSNSKQLEIQEPKNKMKISAILIASSLSATVSTEFQ